ncbi:MAG: hypothetical protein HKN16_09845 [Saprospiraceae bacterium]|nr:hypothetical protein [Saprospiraceae bacterium]
MSLLQKTFELGNLKLFIFFFICILMVPPSNAQPERINQDGLEIPRSLSRKFKRDAARLALRLESKEEDLRYLDINIPKRNIQQIYQMLTKIYQSEERARSVAKCNVHTFPNPSIDHMVLIFERDVEWAWPLLDGINETDSEEFNELLDDYDLVIDRHVQWNDTQDAITIRSKEPLNMAALANEFYNIDGIKNIDLGIPKIGGNDINLWRKSNGWEFEFVLRFGSYVAGKGNVYIWTFFVDDLGAVDFVSEGGDPLPEYMKCNFSDFKPIFVKN